MLVTVSHMLDLLHGEFGRPEGLKMLANKYSMILVIRLPTEDAETRRVVAPIFQSLAGDELACAVFNQERLRLEGQRIARRLGID